MFSMTGEKSMYMLNGLNGLVCFPREPVVKLLFLVISSTGTFNMNEKRHSQQRLSKWARTDIEVEGNLETVF